MLLTSILKTSSSMDSLTSATQIIVENDWINDNSDHNGDFNRNFVF